MGKSKKTSRESETYRLMRVKPPVKVTFNVGGTTFQTSEATVKRVKNHNFKVNLIDYKHNAELQRTDPGTKVTIEFSIRAVFSHIMLEMDFYYFRRFS